MKTLQDAREIIARLADQEREHVFAQEVRAGCWDHRDDVQNARLSTFRPRKLRK